MRQPTRHTAAFVLLSLLASLLAVTTTAGTAVAAESIPALQWGPVQASNSTTVNLTSPTGSVTVPCSTARGGSDLKTYSATGTLTQDISRTSTIDGVNNCITQPTVDKNGDDYGTVGHDLLAYTGNTLKWKYPVFCSTDQQSQVAVGADGNIYATTYESDGVHLIGLTPNLQGGSTQPTKVLDIKIQNDCSTMIYPYRDGIMLHGQSSGSPRFYTYAGMLLGGPTASDIWTEKINTEGRLFNYSLVSGSYHSVSINAYDPLTNEVLWTTTASTSGADAQSASLHPMPGGGVAALITEQQMNGSTPVTPTVYVKTLVILNAIGQVTFSQQLPNSDAHGNAYTGTYIAADNTGKVAVARIVNLSTGLSYPTTEPGISIQVYDSITSTWTYSAVMSGDNSKTGGPYGYWFDSQEDNSMVFATNTLFFDAHCMGNCNDTLDRLYPVKVSGVGQDYPRSTTLTLGSPTPYVAMGDSYSSGEGVIPFESATNTSTDTCHRSESAYARLLNQSFSMNLSLAYGGFRACSGATTNEITNANTSNNEAAQISYVNASTKVVTITIGGNDVGFAQFATACVWPIGSACDSSTTIYNSTVNQIDYDLPSVLKTTYEQILKAAPNAEVYVIGYPYVNGVKNSTDPEDVRCPYLYNGQTPWANAQAARDIVGDIDAAISNEVKVVHLESADYNSRLHYVEVNGTNSPFAGHGLCDSGSSYFQNLNQAMTNYHFVFHPNANGQAAYEQLIASAIAAG